MKNQPFIIFGILFLFFNIFISNVHSQQMYTYENNKDNNHISNIQVGDKIIIAGISFEDPILNGSKIQIQEIDQNGNIGWTTEYDFGVKQRVTNLTYDKNSALIVVTGTVVVDGHWNLFILRVSNTGNLIDWNTFTPQFNITDIIPLDIDVSETDGRYYVSAKGGNVSSNFPYNYKPFIYCIDNSLNFIWGNEIDNLYFGPSNNRQVAASSIEEIPNKGYFVTLYRMGGYFFDIIIDYSGNIVWQNISKTSNYTIMGNGIDAEYIPDNDQIIRIGDETITVYNSVSSSSITAINKKVNISIPSPFSFNKDFIKFQDIEYNTTSNLIGIVGFALKNWFFGNGDESYIPFILVLDQSLNIVSEELVHTYNSNYYASNIIPYPQHLKDPELALFDRKSFPNVLNNFNDQFSFLTFASSKFEGNDLVYYKSIILTDNNGHTNLGCLLDINFEIIDEIPIPIVFNCTNVSAQLKIENTLLDQEGYFNSLIDNCFDFKGCGINIVGFNQAYVGCFERELGFFVNLNQGTLITKVIWDFGDGSPIVTIPTLASQSTLPQPLIHQFIGSKCQYYVCVTIEAVGWDGITTCYKKYCNTMDMVNFGDCSSCSNSSNSRIKVSELSQDGLPYFKVYPNPSSSMINIESSEDCYSITIYDMNGNLLIERNFSGSVNKTMLTDMLSTGMYLIKFKSSTGLHFDKLIIK